MINVGDFRTDDDVLHAQHVLPPNADDRRRVAAAHEAQRASFAAQVDGSLQSRDAASEAPTVPRDLWRHVDFERFLPFNRSVDASGNVVPLSEEQVLEARAKAVARCKELIDACANANVLREWRDHADSAGDAASVLHALIGARIAEIDGTAPKAAPSPERPAKVYCAPPPPDEYFARIRRARRPSSGPEAA